MLTSSTPHTDEMHLLTNQGRRLVLRKAFQLVTSPAVQWPLGWSWSISLLLSDMLRCVEGAMAITPDAVCHASAVEQGHYYQGDWQCGHTDLPEERNHL